MISTPNWQWPTITQAPGSWLLLTVIALVGIVWAPRVLSAVALWRASIPVALTYGLAVIALLAAMAVFTLILPAYQDASELRVLGFQPGASSAATDCATLQLQVAQFTRNVFIQFALLLLALALLSGAVCAWLRARWRKR